jgi:hypothetical protein
LQFGENCSQEFHDLFPSRDITRTIKSRRMGWAMHVILKGEVRNAYTILAGKQGGERLHRRPRRRL